MRNMPLLNMQVLQMMVVILVSAAALKMHSLD
jgi:hypothetical protein